MSSRAFKVGDRVKIYNGGRLEGTATIKGLCSTPDDYDVHFDGDHPREFWRRTVMPQWQEEGFTPLSPDAEREQRARDELQERFRAEIERREPEVGHVYGLEVDEQTAAEIKAFSEGRRS